MGQDKEKKVASIKLSDGTRKDLIELKGNEDAFKLFELFDRLEVDMTMLTDLEDKYKSEFDKIKRLTNKGTKDKKTKEIRSKMAKEIAYKITNLVMRKSYKAKDLIFHLIGKSFDIDNKTVEAESTPQFLTLAMTMIVGKNYSAIVGFFMSNNE